MQKISRPALILAACAAMLPLAACGTFGGGNRDTSIDTRYVARDVNTLYNAGWTYLQRGQYQLAAAVFDEVERQHPYSVWARRAQLMSAFSWYAAQEHQKSIDSARRFLSIHPGNRDAPYALYLIALNYYEQITDVTRDQSTTQQALDALGEVVRRYPTTRYADDARLKIDLVRDHLAGKEMEIGRFYQRRRQWLASVLRFRKVIDDYQTTSHVPEALMRLTESYLALGIPEEARKAAAVLGANYPATDWYQRAYQLMQNYHPNPERAREARAEAAEAPAQTGEQPSPANPVTTEAGQQMGTPADNQPTVPPANQPFAPPATEPSPADPGPGDQVPTEATPADPGAPQSSGA